ncbi:MAG: hypothetical protein ACOYMV_14390 [Verrucomicrobiia bacterium]|jgi:hypothetical protein
MTSRDPHPSRDYAALAVRWRRLMRVVRLSLVEVARVSGYPVYGLRTVP